MTASYLEQIKDEVRGASALPKERWLRYVLLAGLVLRIVLAITIFARLGEQGFLWIVDDGFTYSNIAVNLVAGHGYTTVAHAPYYPDSIRPPMLPILMALSLKLFHTLMPIVALHILISLLPAILVYNIAGLVGLPAKVRSIASAIAVLEPGGMMLSVLLISEPLFLVFLLFSLYLFVKLLQEKTINPVSAALLGATLALAAYARPIAWYFVWIVPLALVLHRIQLWKRGVIVLAISLILLFPWLLRNRLTYGLWAWSPSGVQIIYINFVATMNSFMTGKSISETEKAQYDHIIALTHLPEDDVYNWDLRLNPLMTREAARAIIAHPWYAAKAFLYSQFGLFTQDSYRFYYLNRLAGWKNYNAEFNPTLDMFRRPVANFPRLYTQLKQEYFVSLVGRLFYAVSSALGLAGIIAMTLNRRYRELGLALAFFVGYFALATTAVAFGAIIRMRYPIQALLFLGAVYFLYLIKVRYVHRHYSADI